MIIKYFMIRSIVLAYDISAIQLIMFVIFSVYINTSSTELKPRNVFVTLSLISILRMQAIYAVNKFAHAASDARVAWKRIKVSITYKILLFICLYRSLFFLMSYYLNLQRSINSLVS